MKRILLNFLAAVSLLLLMALAVAWLRQPVHTSCFSTSLPGGRLLIVTADHRLNVAVWRDWPAWERPAVHSHVAYSEADRCGPNFSVPANAGGSVRETYRGFGVRVSDVVAAYVPGEAGKPPLWPERRPSPPAGWCCVVPPSTTPPPPPPKASFRQFDLPYWMAFAALAPLAVLRLSLAAAGAVRSRRRLQSGLCIRCGYDLRATPGQCPECGAAPLPAGATGREPRLLNPLTVFLLLSCAALLWLMSRPGVQAYTLWTTFDARWELRTSTVTVGVQRRTRPPSAWAARPPLHTGRFPFFGYNEFPVAADPQPDGTSRPAWVRAWYTSSLVLPLAFVVLLSSATVRIGRTVRRRTRHARGRCRHCGYDLTGNVSGVCPECGTGR